MAVALRDKKVTVIGLGRSGRAAARLLAHQQARVTVTDQRPSGAVREGVKGLENCPIRYFLGGHPAEAFQGADLIVISPGIAVDGLEPVRVARSAGVPVIGEMELAFGYATAPIVAISGTNGKSTTTVLAGEILKASGRKVFVGGNLGRPFSEAVPDPGGRKGWDWIILEVSSFQLETIRAFRPSVAVMLNVTPNHLDRYKGMNEYRAAKWRLFENQTREDVAIVNADDPVVFENSGSLRGRRLFISRTPRPEEGVYLESGRVVSTGSGSKPRHVEILRQGEILLRGSHNLENVLAASAVGVVCGCPAEAIRSAVKKFEGLEHRLETVRLREGVLFVNDSKATTIAALARSLESFTEPIVLIAGGRYKGGDFSDLCDSIRRRVKAAILLGEAQPVIRKALEGATLLMDARSLGEAVRLAGEKAISGDVVLLAPACSSLDMFRDFEDRGRQFKEAVHGL